MRRLEGLSTYKGEALGYGATVLVARATNPGGTLGRSRAGVGPIGLWPRIGCRPSVEACSGALSHGKRLICPST